MLDICRHGAQLAYQMVSRVLAFAVMVTTCRTLLVTNDACGIIMIIHRKNLKKAEES
jgi:hypothetical protein